MSFGSLLAESNKNTEEGMLSRVAVLRLRDFTDEVLREGRVFFSYFLTQNVRFGVWILFFFHSLLFPGLRVLHLQALIFLIVPLNPGRETHTKCITRASVMLSINGCRK